MAGDRVLVLFERGSRMTDAVGELIDDILTSERIVSGKMDLNRDGGRHREVCRPTARLRAGWITLLRCPSLCRSARSISFRSEAGSEVSTVFRRWYQERVSQCIVGWI